MINKLFLLIISFSFCFGEYYYSYGKRVQLSPLDNNNTSISRGLNSADKDRVLYYKKGKHTLGVDGTLLVKFKKNANHQKILKEFNLSKITAMSPSLWLVRVQDISQTIDISNKLYKHQDIQFAHPDFLQKIQNRSLDTKTQIPWYKDLWHLKKNDSNDSNPALNISKIFNITKGDGVKIGVIDDGLDANHEDLKENIAFYSHGENPNIEISVDLKIYESHGTAMTGIIASLDDNKGSLGIAPSSKIYFVKHDFKRTGEIKPSHFILALKWFKNEEIGVVSASWGTYSVDEALKDYIDYLSYEHNIVIVFAAGNDGYDLDDDDYNDESEVESAIGVSTVERDGSDFAYYSNYGSNIDLLTIGDDIVTTRTYKETNRYEERIDSLSNESGDKIKSEEYYRKYRTYRQTSGTSASTAIVSSVVGLMLSINPYLSVARVKSILYNSSSLSISKEDKKYPVLNAYNAIQAVLETQNIEDIQRQLLKNPIKKISGEFAYYDFENSPVHTDWVLIQKNKHYRLFGTSSSLENTLGFSPIDKKQDLETSFYLVNRFGVDTFASSHWILIHKDTSLVFLLQPQGKTIKYTLLDLSATINDKTITLTN